MNAKVLLGFILLFCCSCQEQNTQVPLNEKDRILHEIKSLETDEQRSKYLYDLWHADQNYRGGQEGEIVTKHGYRSEEHLAYLEKWNSSDNLVFNKLKTYLEIQGYPTNRGAYHELALNAFPTIIGHYHNYEAQLELLPYLYEAYKKEHCSLDDVVWLLGEMYESKHQGQHYQMKTDRFTTAQQFLELQEALKLNLTL